MKDSKMVYRLDNCLGPQHLVNMAFWDYVDEGKSDSKKKVRFKNQVAKAHWVFRNFMGSVDQADVKATVMNLTRQIVRR